MDKIIKLIPFIVGTALGVVATTIILKTTSHLTETSFKDFFLLVPAVMVMATGLYIIYRSFKDLRLKEE